MTHDGDNPYAPVVDPIEKTERKAAESLSPDVAQQHGSYERPGRDRPQRALDLFDQAEPESGEPVLVERSGFEVLRFR